MSQPTTTSDLDLAVASAVAEGYSVESLRDSQAILSRKAPIGWFWNSALTLLTGGLWLIVVFFRIVNRKTERVVLTVDASGRVRRQ